MTLTNDSKGTHCNTYQSTKPPIVLFSPRARSVPGLPDDFSSNANGPSPRGPSTMSSAGSLLARCRPLRAGRTFDAPPHPTHVVVTSALLAWSGPHPDLLNWNDRRPKGASHKQPLPAGNRPFRMLADCLRLVMGTPSRPKTRPSRGLPVPWTKRSKRWIGGRSRRNKENSQPILRQDESTRGRFLRWLWFSGKGSQDSGLPSSQWNWLLVWNTFGNWNARWNWMVRHVDWLVPCLNSSLLENWMIGGSDNVECGLSRVLMSW